VLQILWLNLTTDGAPAIALAVEATEPNTMREGPRLRTEPLLEKVMVTGMVIQAITLTTVVLVVYVIGLQWELGVIPIDGQPEDLSIFRAVYGGLCGPEIANDTSYCNQTVLCNQTWDANPQNIPCFSVFPHYITDADFERGYEVASTMVTFTIIFAELARAYSSRSMRESVFTIGLFSNSWMQYGVFTAVLATWLLYVIPGIKDIFAMRELTGREFGLVFGLCFIPFCVDEFCKLIYRKTGYGKRPIVVAKLAGVSIGDAASTNKSYLKVTDEKQSE
jgi:Ca2+-transporting ATPase